MEIIVITYGQILAGLGMLVLLIVANWLANYRSQGRANKLVESALHEVETYVETAEKNCNDFSLVDSQPIDEQQAVRETTTPETNAIVSVRWQKRENNFQREAWLCDQAQRKAQEIVAGPQRQEYIQALRDEYEKLDWWSDRAHAIHTILIEVSAAEEARQRAL